jgi:glyoxylase-like metal-dependent hydrolase (beta-lactamase superfamily II)
VLTHDHGDHAEAVPQLAERLGGRDDRRGALSGTQVLADGDVVGPFTAYASPGHAPDHLAYVADGVAFTGDAVLGTGSVFVWPDPGALRGYLAALERLRALDLRQIAPGHGPLVDDPPPSSTSTSPTAWTASAACSPRSTAAGAASTSCWTRPGQTRPRCCGPRRR